MILPHSYAMLHWLTRATIEGAITGGLVLIAQFLLRRRISARWRYNLWLLVLLRLVLPALPGNRYSPFNLAPWHAQHESVPAVRIAQPAALPIPMPAAPSRPLPSPDLLAELARGQNSPEELERELNAHDARVDQSPDVVATYAQSSSDQDSKDAQTPMSLMRNESPTHESKTNAAVSAATVAAAPWAKIRAGLRAIATRWVTIVFVGWLAIAALLIVRAFIISVRLRLCVRAMPGLEDDALCTLLRRCCVEAAVSAPPEVREAPSGLGPALVGLMRPILLLPKEVITTLDGNEIRLVLLHELIHLRRRDVAMNWVWVAISAIHWFNPLVWWMLARMRADRELACDEAVLRIGMSSAQSASRDYGQAMLKLLERYQSNSLMAAAVGVLDGSKRTRDAQMRRRITMIAQFRNSSGWSLQGLILTLGLGAVALTGAVRAQQSTVPPAKQQPPAAMSGGAGQIPGMAGAMAGGAPGGTALDVGAGLPGASIGTPTGGRPPVGGTPGQPSLPGAAGEVAPLGLPGAAMSAHVEDSDAVAADARTIQALRHPLVADFADLPLSEVANYLSDACKADFFIDAKALQEEGIATDASINLHIRQPLPAEELMRLALRSAGGDTLAYGIFHGVIHITTRAALERAQTTRVYSISDFADRADELKAAITQSIAPGSWSQSGGMGSILVLGKKLIVTSAEPHQREIGRLLSLLREKDIVGAAETPHAQTPDAELPDAETLAQTNPRVARIMEQIAAAQSVLKRLRIQGLGNSHPQVRDAQLKLDDLNAELDTLRNQFSPRPNHAAPASAPLVIPSSEPTEAQEGIRANTLWWIARQRSQQVVTILEQKFSGKKLDYQEKQLLEEARARQEKLKAIDVNGVSVPGDMADYFRELYRKKYMPRNGSNRNLDVAAFEAFSNDAYRQIYGRFQQDPFNWHQPPIQTEVSIQVGSQTVQVPPQLAGQAQQLWNEHFKDKIYILNGIPQNEAAVRAEYQQSLDRLVAELAKTPADSEGVRQAIDRNPRVVTLRQQITSLEEKIADMYQKGLVDAHQEMIRAHHQLDELRIELWDQEQAVRSDLHAANLK